MIAYLLFQKICKDSLRRCFAPVTAYQAACDAVVNGKSPSEAFASHLRDAYALK